MKRRTSKEIAHRLLSGSTGLRPRVNSNCVTCTYDECSPGTWRHQIESCTVKTCAFWPIRPRTCKSTARYTPTEGGLELSSITVKPRTRL